MEIVDCIHTSLSAIGKDEHWIRDWVIKKPSRLGLGEIEIKRHELVRREHHGGRLDILAYRRDIHTFYEIEIMMDDSDADHGIRTLAFWSRERLKNPDANHVAVLVSEALSVKYQSLLEGLPQVLPFIGIDIKVLMLPSKKRLVAILPSIIVQSRDVTIEIGDLREPRNKIARLYRGGERRENLS